MLAEESFTIVTPCLKRFSLASGVVKIFAPERKDSEEEREKERKRERNKVGEGVRERLGKEQ